MMKTMRVMLCALALVCALSGCKRDAAQTGLSPEAVAAALERAGLPGEVSETESTPDTHYVVRDPSQTYEGGGSVLVADVSCGYREDGRTLSASFDRTGSERFDWEDWKRQIVFATLLYGGFESEDEIYRAFCNQELPAEQAENRRDVQLPEGHVATAEWDAQLSAGYCRAVLSDFSRKAYDGDGFEYRRHNYLLRVSIYAAREQYEALRTAETGGAD